MRLTVPALLPSISTSRALTTTASATAGFVTAMRVMSNGVTSTVERPAVSSTRSKPLVSVACAAGAWGVSCAAIGDTIRHARTAPNARRGIELESTNFHLTVSSDRLAARMVSTV